MEKNSPFATHEMNGNSYEQESERQHTIPFFCSCFRFCFLKTGSVISYKQGQIAITNQMGNSYKLYVNTTTKAT
jgi:hypothetical protein